MHTLVDLPSNLWFIKKKAIFIRIFKISVFNILVTSLSSVKKF